MTQTWAILLDAYRELNSKKLFWIVMALSGLVVAVFAMMGNNERGLTFLHWTIDFEFASTRFFPSDQFYKIIFVNFGLAIWLTWIALALALVSTASIFPDFLAGGAIELALSKPIGRLRLFLTKYAAGLLFVFMQVAMFTGASFLVIGLRGGSWEPRILLAIPIVVLVFSYLYCVLVLVGVMWRSTIASLLVTLLVWFVIFLVNIADNTLLMIRTGSEMRVQAMAQQVDALRAEVKELEAQASGAAPRPESPAPEKPKEGGLLAGLRYGLEKSGADAADPDAELKSKRSLLESRQKRLEAMSGTRDSMVRWHGIAFGAKTALPKTGETTALMQRYVVDMSSLRQLRADGNGDEAANMDFGDPEEGVRVDQRKVAEKVEEQMEARTEWWIIGTSLLFEAAVMSLAAWIFCRREF